MYKCTSSLSVSSTFVQFCVLGVIEACNLNHRCPFTACFVHRHDLLFSVYVVCSICIKRCWLWYYSNLFFGLLLICFLVVQSSFCLSLFFTASLLYNSSLYNSSLIAVQQQYRFHFSLYHLSRVLSTRSKLSSLPSLPSNRRWSSSTTAPSWFGKRVQGNTSVPLPEACCHPRQPRVISEACSTDSWVVEQQ